MSTGGDGAGHDETYTKRLPPRVHLQGRMHGVCYLCSRLPGCGHHGIPRNYKGRRSRPGIIRTAQERRREEFLGKKKENPSCTSWPLCVKILSRRNKCQENYGRAMKRCQTPPCQR